MKTLHKPTHAETRTFYEQQLALNGVKATSGDAILDTLSKFSNRLHGTEEAIFKTFGKPEDFAGVPLEYCLVCKVRHAKCSDAW